MLTSNVGAKITYVYTFSQFLLVMQWDHSNVFFYFQFSLQMKGKFFKFLQEDWIQNQSKSFEFVQIIELTSVFNVVSLVASWIFLLNRISQSMHIVAIQQYQAYYITAHGFRAACFSFDKFETSIINIFLICMIDNNIYHYINYSLLLLASTIEWSVDFLSNFNGLKLWAILKCLHLFKSQFVPRSV